ncbi:hypothetical protein EHV15_34475 [Paenibacillus oralis]|uniref:Uncharacterized protein n=1 Tax=Paenibacillus oralis TaxID=2490856 RepID=A0A3P3T9H7_9BACL|nr:hypothetical protein [Paenibacillus oralis]RRJ54705.1 hypothetical protein EHV15_34475 [Paenibacillus oralis]
MIEEITVNRSESETLKKRLKKEGWLSAHYYTRRGVNIVKLRNLAKRNEIDAKLLSMDGTTTWYYKETDVNRLKSENMC